MTSATDPLRATLALRPYQAADLTGHPNNRWRLRDGRSGGTTSPSEPPWAAGSGADPAPAAAYSTRAQYEDER